MKNVFRYDGTFELAFLRDDESVRSDGFLGIEVIDANEQIIATAQKDDVLVRKANGDIDVIRAIGKYEQTQYTLEQIEQLEIDSYEPKGV